MFNSHPKRENAVHSFRPLACLCSSGREQTARQGWSLGCVLKPNPRPDFVSCLHLKHTIRLFQLSVGKDLDEKERGGEESKIGRRRFWKEIEGIESHGGQDVLLRNGLEFTKA